jgi:hypothetical protein
MFGEYPTFSGGDHVSELHLSVWECRQEDLKPLAQALGATKDLPIGSEVYQFEVLAHQGGGPIGVMVVECVE